MGFTLGLAQTGFPADGNVLAQVRTYAARARERGVDLLVFPENLVCPQELDTAGVARIQEPLDGPFARGMGHIAKEHGLWMAFTMYRRGTGNAGGTCVRGGAGGAGDRSDSGGTCVRGGVDDAGDAGVRGGAGGRTPFNTAVVVDDAGVVRGTYDKCHLYDAHGIRESDRFRLGDELCRPIATPFGTIGIGICYDLRFPEVARSLTVGGCDLLLFPAAWHDGPNKLLHWQTLLRARAIENECFVAGVCHGGERYVGTSFVFDPLGNELTQGREDLLVCDVDPRRAAAARDAMPVLEHRRPTLYA